MNINLRIEDRDSLIELTERLKKAKLLKETTKVSISDDCFPMDIPLDADKLLAILEKPMVGKVFGKGIGGTLTAHLEPIVGMS